MPSSRPPSIGSLLADCLRVTLGYGRLLAEKVPPSRFAHMPHEGMNHPAFCYGHLSLYPDRVLGLIGRSDLVAEPEGYTALFKPGTSCVEQDGRYPGKDEIMRTYSGRHEAVLAVLAEVDDAVFHRENPVAGRSREMFPTIGAAVNFYLNNHHMTHLGQVSAWRRAMGLGPAMSM